MYPIKEYGSEKLSNNFASVLFNQIDEHYYIAWNTKYRSPLNQTFKISNDYDFGSLDIKDLLVELYLHPTINIPGISRVL